VYYRLHGSPKIYYSEYSEPYLEALAASIAGHERAGRRVWCIFDNTAEGAAVPNALSLLGRLQRFSSCPSAGSTRGGDSSG
jgi:uncharacterized protein YecE (DUF72 family)